MDGKKTAREQVRLRAQVAGHAYAEGQAKLLPTRDKPGMHHKTVLSFSIPNLC